MKLYKRICSLLVMSSLLTTICANVFAMPPREEDDRLSVEEIMMAYDSSVRSQIVIERSNAPLQASLAPDYRQQLIEERDYLLESNGYEVYHVNSDTFSAVETSLNTDLTAVGLDPAYSYLVVVDGNDPDAVNTARSSTSAFNYTYNGVMYAMRYLYVYAGDEEADPGFGQTSEVNVLNSTVQSLINNCLNTVISAFISGISSTLGTVASICGLSIDLFGNSASASLNLNAATNWSRIYTQVYESYDQAWVYGSSVEYVTAFSHMSGSYYNSISNRYESVPEDEAYTVTYSTHYNDFTWRKDTAIQRYLAGLPCMKDTTGAVSYQYGGVTKITHYENF